MTSSDDRTFRTWIQPIVCEDIPDAHTVWFAVGWQQFCVTRYEMDTKEDAEAFRSMLETALNKIAEGTRS